MAVKANAEAQFNAPPYQSQVYHTASDATQSKKYGQYQYTGLIFSVQYRNDISLISLPLFSPYLSVI